MFAPFLYLAVLIKMPGDDAFSGTAFASMGYHPGIMNHTTNSKPTIYVVDDDADDRELLTEAFQQVTDRHHLKAISNGKTLIDLLSGKTDAELPCLIVLDYNMPELNGMDVLKYLQNSVRYRRIPKVIYTTSNSWVEQSEFMALGANEFLTKAVNFKGILDSVKTMLGHCDNEVRETA